MVGLGLQPGVEAGMPLRWVAAGESPGVKPLSLQVQLLLSAGLVAANHTLLHDGVVSGSKLLM